MSKKNGWQKVGVIGVDAGLCWLGDPCYILKDAGKERPKDIGKDWMEFCDKLGEEYPTLKQFNYDAGHPGLGICVSTGWGDGEYPVEARIVDGRVAEVRVVFIPKDEDD